MLARRTLICSSWALVAGLGLLAGCSKPAGGGAASAGGGETIAVGAFLSLTGSDSTFGIDTQQGIELATEQTNAAGGVKGKKIKIVAEDDKSSPQEASIKVKQLIDRDHVVAVLGEVASSRSLAGGQVANTSHVPMITPSSTNVTVTQGKDWVFRACFTDDIQGQQAAVFAVTGQHRTKLAILFAAQDAYSSGLAQTFRDEAKRLGATIVADKGYQKGETNFTTYLEQIKAAAPDLVFVPNYYNDMVQIARQAKTLGMSSAGFLGGDGWDSEDLLKGAAAELEGSFFTNHYAPDVPWPNSQRFVADYRAKFHREPSSLAAQGYDAAKLLYDAMTRAPDLKPESIKNAIASTKGFQGATGTLSIDANHNAQKPLVVVRITGGKFTYFSTAGG